MSLWIKHPRTKKSDSMLTFSFYALLICLLKFIFSGTELVIGSFSWKFGIADSATIGVILGATLTAYVGRKWKSPPRESSGESDDKK